MAHFLILDLGDIKVYDFIFLFEYYFWVFRSAKTFIYKIKLIKGKRR